MDDVTPALDRATQLLAENRLAESEAAFSAVVSSGQLVSKGLYGLGLVHLKQNDLAGADSYFQAAVQRDPRHAYALYERGTIAQRRQDWTAARSFFLAALAIDPQHKAALQALQELPPQIAQPPRAAADTYRAMPASGPVSPPSWSASGSAGYGIYDTLVEDTNPQTRDLSQKTLATIYALNTHVRPLLSAYLGTFLGLGSWAIVAIVVFSTASSVMIQGHSGEQGVDEIVGFWTVLTLVTVFFLLPVGFTATVIWARSREIWIERGRIVIERGVLSKEKRSFEVWRIVSVTVRRSLLNRLTGDGTLLIDFHLSTSQGGYHNTRQQPSHLVLKGIAKGGRLEDIRLQLLDLNAYLIRNPALKGLLSF